MKLTEEGRFTYAGGTSLYVRLWEDEHQIEKPVVLVEVEKGYTSKATQIGIAQDVAKTLETTPDKLAWYEQSREGALKEVAFQPFPVEFRPYGSDLNQREYQQAEKEGWLQPQSYTHYTPKERDVSPDEKKALQAKVSDRLESQEEKQNREFDQLNFRFQPEKSL